MYFNTDEPLTVSERSQSQETKYSATPFIWNGQDSQVSRRQEADWWLLRGRRAAAQGTRLLSGGMKMS